MINMTRKDIIQSNMMYNMATTKASKSMENVKPMKRIFDLNTFINYSLDVCDGELPKPILESITGWAKEINGKEVKPLGNMFICVIYIIEKEWTKEVEC